MQQLGVDWDAARTSLDAYGHADLGPVMDGGTRRALIDAFDDEARFRSRIDMARHGFGQGVYKYFGAPLPAPVQDLRQALYPELARIANGWETEIGLDRRFPETLEGMLAACHAAGQSRPSPLLLRYGRGDYNCLHQDLYGPVVFPVQVVILLSDRDAFTGGQFMLTEQRPRMQSRAEVVELAPGHAVAFAVSDRPRQGRRGTYRVKQRHGVSRLLSGERFTLGIIFHDAA
jgi:hypothetical protein